VDEAKRLAPEHERHTSVAGGGGMCGPRRIPSHRFARHLPLCHHAHGRAVRGARIAPAGGHRPAQARTPAQAVGRARRRGGRRRGRGRGGRARALEFVGDGVHRGRPPPAARLEPPPKLAEERGRRRGRRWRRGRGRGREEGQEQGEGQEERCPRFCPHPEIVSPDTGEEKEGRGTGSSRVCLHTLATSVYGRRRGGMVVVARADRRWKFCRGRFQFFAGAPETHQFPVRAAPCPFPPPRSPFLHI
jgi:hypothetical protein